MFKGFKSPFSCTPHLGRPHPPLAIHLGLASDTAVLPIREDAHVLSLGAYFCLASLNHIVCLCALPYIVLCP